MDTLFLGILSEPGPLPLGKPSLRIRHINGRVGWVIVFGVLDRLLSLLWNEHLSASFLFLSRFTHLELLHFLRHSLFNKQLQTSLIILNIDIFVGRLYHLVGSWNLNLILQGNSLGLIRISHKLEINTL